MDEDLASVVAPNLEPFTAGGTSSWLVGRGELCVINPGPEDPRHLAALLDTIGGRQVAAIVVTHAHLDHSGLALSLAAATDAPVLTFRGARAGLRQGPGRASDG